MMLEDPLRSLSFMRLPPFVRPFKKCIASKRMPSTPLPYRPPPISSIEPVV